MVLMALKEKCLRSGQHSWPAVSVAILDAEIERMERDSGYRYEIRCTKCDRSNVDVGHAKNSLQGAIQHRRTMVRTR